jgi:hypothetical protein
MNFMQIKFKLAMEYLGIPIKRENYRTLCNAVYSCLQKGIYISPARVELDTRTGRAFSPLSHETGGNPSRSLLDDVSNIEREISSGMDDSKRFKLDERSIEILNRIKEDLHKR